MKCPIDETTLAITERQGIEIDYCPQCRGVWLDRGELDKLIAGGTERPGDSYERPPERTDDRRGSHSYDTTHGYKKKKKESWLGDVFDF
ncbi:MAG TPA: zf-TFIIB domain-containing protein [Pyrinomonadaceae bacterium]|nr:zf-TFIIB domain-containing protein [Pyrinomonadaceae bacterium]